MLFVLCSSLTTSAIAHNYYTQHAVGWHWYHNSVKRKSKKSLLLSPEKRDASQQIKSIKKTMKRALDNAILNPTSKNVMNYIVLQNQLSRRAYLFSAIWQQALMSHPELNFSLEHPTNNVALQIYHGKQNRDINKAILEFSKHYGLVYFYKSQCRYCQRFSPIIKAFAQDNGIKIIPVTLDGIKLPEFPDSRIDNGQAVKFNVTMTPSLYAVDPYTEKAFPVSYGLVTTDELKEGILRIIKQAKRDTI